MSNTIKGYVTRVIHETKNIISSNVDDEYTYDNEYDDELFFVVLEIIDKDGNFEKYKIKGDTLASPEINDEIVCKDYYITEDKYGKTYVGKCIIDVILPKKEELILERIKKYIKIKGIGDKTIKTFVEKYKNDIWNVKNMNDIKNCDKKEIQIFEKLNDYIKSKKDVRQTQKERISEFFVDRYGLCLTPKELNNVCVKLDLYNCDIELNDEYVKDNILKLIYVIDNEKLEKLRNHLLGNDDFKICIEILKKMHDNLKNGSTCIDASIFGKEKKKSIKYLKKNKYIYIYHNFIYLKEQYKIEKKISKSLSMFKKNHNFTITINDNDIDEKLNDKQKEAIKKAFKENILIITGFPGVGKTTTSIEIAKVCKNKGLNIIFLGPTGKVCLKIKTDLNNAKLRNDNVFTIHKYLGILKYVDNAEETYDFYDYNEILDSYAEPDVIIIDELSMVSNEIMCDLLTQLINMKISSKLIFMGDVDQLPSIAPGYLLKSLIDSNRINTVQLTEMQRGTGELKDKIKEIKENGTTSFNVNSFKFESINCIEQCEKILCNEITTMIETNTRAFDNIMVITPTHNNIIKLTNKIRSIVNKNYKNESKNENTFIIGDFVMVKKNIYYRDSCIVYNKQHKFRCKENKCDGCNKCVIMKIKEDVYNGSIGKVVKYDNGFYDIEIYGKQINISDVYVKKYFSFAYINTVHKFQGSENDMAILIITENDKNMINKNLIYTAISRAKHRCLIISYEDLWTKGLKRKCNRISKLDEMLRKYILLDNDKQENINISNGIDINMFIKKHKQSIPHVMRIDVWDKWIGKEKGIAKCMCCNKRDIEQLNFECGHVVAESNGGEMSIDNLRPICKPCNQSMSTKNMNEFMEICGYHTNDATNKNDSDHSNKSRKVKKNKKKSKIDKIFNNESDEKYIENKPKKLKK